MRHFIGIVFAILLVTPFQVLAQGKVEKIKGSVQSITDGKRAPLAKGATVNWGAQLMGEEGSYILVAFPERKVVFSGKFLVKLEKNDAAKSSLINLVYGKLRASGKPAGEKPLSFQIKTPSAVAGVRGTDFFVSFLPLLGETEVICFESSVDFAGADGKSKALIKAGQWGGHGGRFGGTIRPPIDLSKEILDHFSGSMPL